MKKKSAKRWTFVFIFHPFHEEINNSITDHNENIVQLTVHAVATDYESRALTNSVSRGNNCANHAS